MLVSMLKFELKYQFSQITFKAAALLFFILGLLAIQGNYGGDEVHKNAPYVITTIVGLLSMSSIFVTTILCASVVMRDATYKMDSMIYTTSVERLPYFATKFTGLVLSVLFILALALAGLFVGSFFADSSERGTFDLLFYCQPLLVFGFPNILFSASLIFCSAMLTRNVRAVYVAGLLLYILYLTSSILGNSPLLATSTLKVLEPDALPFLLDPFGLASFFDETRSWTDFQRNTLLFPVKKYFLINRLLWTAVAFFTLAITYRLFNLRITIPKSSKKVVGSKTFRATATYHRLAVYPSGLKYSLATFCSQFKLEMQSVFRHIPFMIMLLLWIFIFTIELKDSLFSGPYGIRFYPVTGIIIEELRIIRPALLLIIFYTAELLWRERTDLIEELVYSTPVTNKVMWAAKSATLILLSIVLITANILIGLGIQIMNGQFNFELTGYILLYYYSGVPLLLFTMLFVFIQTITNHKYMGMLVSLAVAFVIIFSSRLGIEHYLLRFASTPDLQYSYLNGFGHYAKTFHWYMVYWTGLTTFLSLLTIAFWQKNSDHTWLHRIKTAGLLRSGPGKLGLALSLLIWISAGVYIYQQTNIEGNYKNKAERTEWQIHYEKKYKSLTDLPQPVIKSVKTQVDIFPKNGQYTVKGNYVLKNESGLPIDKIWAGIDPQVTTATISISQPARQTHDYEFRQQWFHLKKPMLPGAEIRMDFEFVVKRSGFMPFNNENAVVENGSYIELEKYVPFLGYNAGFETDDNRARKDRDLTERVSETSTDLNYHLIDFETIISTAADQEVITVGTLQKSWTKNNRHFFHYKTKQPIGFMFALSAAKYLVKMENYKKIKLKVFYHHGHEANLPAIVDAMKNTIDYCSTNFAPYPLKELTLAEIPQYRGAATAYPGVIFSAERITFLGDFRDPDKINQSYAITAHEVSHQWWANMLAPVQGPGSNFLTESLAKYTEAMVVKKHYGNQQLRNYLKTENNLYFAMRNSDGKELPLLKTTQTFVYYQKGVLALHAIKEEIGEKCLNQMLSTLIKKHTAPFSKVKPEDFLAELSASASDRQKIYINDLLKKVITYNLKLMAISCKPASDGKYELTLKVHIDKIINNSATAPDDDIDIAVFDLLPGNENSSPEPIYKNKIHFNKTETILTITLDKMPEEIQIDPESLYLDRDLTDNVQVVTKFNDI